MIKKYKKQNRTKAGDEPERISGLFSAKNEMEDYYMRDYTNFERCNGKPCCVFAERICADNYKELLEKGKDSNGEEVFGEMLDDLLYLAELIDFMGITSCLAARGTLSERLTDKLTDSIAGLADEVLEKWENYQDKAE